MLRVKKLTDYGIVLLVHCARARGQEPLLTAKELSIRSQLPLPTVSKVLKILCQASLVTSHQGPKGGYGLARDAKEISAADMIAALEGPLAMADCLPPGNVRCDYEKKCLLKNPWHIINERVKSTLQQMSLEEMANQTSRRQALIHRL